jgi:hypothetical protein
MDSGPFQYLKDQLAEVLAWIDRMRESGGLQELAKAWGEKLAGALKKVRDGLIRAWEALKRWLPTISSVYEKIGGLKTVAMALGAFLAGPLVASLGAVIISLKGLAVAILGTPVGWLIALGAGFVALMAHMGALEPLVDGVASGFSAMSGILGEAFQGLLQSLGGLFGDVGGALADANGEIDPQAWRELGEAIGIFTGGALADLISVLSKAIGLISELGKGLGTVAGSLVWGDLNEAESRNMEREAREKRINAARQSGDHETANRLVAEGQAAERGYGLQDTGKGLAVGPGRAPMAAGLARRASMVGEDGRGGTAAGLAARAAKPQEVDVKTEVEVKLTGTLPEGFSAQGSSTSPNTTVNAATRQRMGYR